MNQRIAEDLPMHLRRHLDLVPRRSFQSGAAVAEIDEWWLLDKSPQQRATRALVRLIRGALPAAALTLRLPNVGVFILTGARLFQEALIGEKTAGATR